MFFILHSFACFLLFLNKGIHVVDTSHELQVKVDLVLS